jgi:hypothetical protein
MTKDNLLSLSLAMENTRRQNNLVFRQITAITKRKITGVTLLRTSKESSFATTSSVNSK